jgi:hypothetical protein
MPLYYGDRQGFRRAADKSGSMAVEDACLGHILFLLWRHFREILTTGQTARPKRFAGDIVLRDRGLRHAMFRYLFD